MNIFPHFQTLIFVLNLFENLIYKQKEKLNRIESKEISTGLAKARKDMMRMIYEEDKKSENRNQNLEQLLVKLKAKPKKKPHLNYKDFKAEQMAQKSLTKAKKLGLKSN